MSLLPGAKLGHYEIVSSLGAGGMGEVYRARDTKLGREVALKTILEQVSSDAERMARFEREARLLASLNHPNIATLHGFEESEGTRFLVMELVEGETLADRIARGPIPVTEAIPLFLQIAEGLEAAHDRGVVHRDLKPGNIKLGEPGSAVKILDFGLAKATSDADVAPSGDAAESPTLTLAATQRGEILGTAAYMAPEQAKGRAVDARADVWALGVCLFEALSGKRPFAGNDATEVLGAVVLLEPDWSALPSGLSRTVRGLLDRSLRKDLRERIRHVADFRHGLEDASSEPVVVGTKKAGLAAREGLAWGLLALAISAASGIYLSRSSQPAERRTARLTLPVPDFKADSVRGLAISPGGDSIVYPARSEGSPLLYRRTLDRLEPQPILGTEGMAGNPILSPNGQWVAFLTRDGTLRKIPVRGGRAIDLVDDARGLGGDWYQDGRGGGKLLYVTDSIIRVVNEDGQTSRPVTGLLEDELFHEAPRFLPGGEAFLFSMFTDTAGGVEIAVQRLDETRHTRLLPGRRPHYVRSGHLVFSKQFQLWAVPFDAEALELRGEPRPLDEEVAAREGVLEFVATHDGRILYAPRGEGVRGPLVWIDRDGRETSVGLEPAGFVQPRTSPDGRRIAVLNVDGVGGLGRKGRVDVHLVEDGSHQARAVARESLTSLAPLWNAQGDVLYFSGWSFEHSYAVWQSDGVTSRRVGLQGLVAPVISSRMPDGRLLLSIRGVDGGDIIAFDPRTAESENILVDASDTGLPTVSPDGRWFAYVLREQGRREITISSLTGDGPRESYKVAEGDYPLWGSAGELFFLRGDALMSLPVTDEPPFATGDPTVVVRGPYFEDLMLARPYDYDPTNDRFLVVRHRTEPRSLVLIEGLDRELEAMFAE